MTLAGEHYRNTTKRIRKVVLEYVMKCVLCNGAGEYKQLYVIGCGRDTLEFATELPCPRGIPRDM